MKPQTIHRFALCFFALNLAASIRLVTALTAGLGLIHVDLVTAQTFTTLHSFAADPAPFYTNSDGAFLNP